jgi:hypothetical protein
MRNKKRGTRGKKGWRIHKKYLQGGMKWMAESVS